MSTGKLLAMSAVYVAALYGAAWLVTESVKDQWHYQRLTVSELEQLNDNMGWLVNTVGGVQVAIEHVDGVPERDTIYAKCDTIYISTPLLSMDPETMRMVLTLQHRNVNGWPR